MEFNKNNEIHNIEQGYFYNIEPIDILRAINQIARYIVHSKTRYQAMRSSRIRRKKLISLATMSYALLKNKTNFSQHYNIIENGCIRSNIFKDLSFLGEFEIRDIENDKSIPSYTIKNDDIVKIMYEACPALIEITDAEIKEIDWPHPSLELLNIRNKYSNPENISNLFVFSSYHRELYHIKNAIYAINCCSEINSDLLDKHVHKYAILSCLSTIGKVFTTDNFTLATSNLNLLSNNEIQLFFNIRNQIIGNRITPETIKLYLTNENIPLIINELIFLRAIFESLHEKLKSTNNTNSLKTHYLKISATQNTNTNFRFPKIKKLFDTLDSLDAPLIDANQSIPTEIFQLQELLKNADGIENLYTFTKNTTTIELSYDNAIDFTNKAIEENQDPSLSDKLINAIKNLLSHNLPNIITQDKNDYIVLELSDELSLSEAIIYCERKLRFIKFLKENPIIKLSIEYHLERLAKFIEISSLDLLAKLFNLKQEKEILAFKNNIAHDFNKFKPHNMQEKLICHNLATIFQRYK